MADEDLIACVYPFEDAAGKGAEMMQLPTNKSRRIPPKYTVTEGPSDRHDRASTEPLETSGNDPPYFHSPGLALRFSTGPKTTNGFVFGHDKNCDIVLPRLSSISSYQFALTFDEQHRPIIKDLETFNGTEVVYDRKGHGRRRSFFWIVGGAKLPNNVREIVINVNRVLKLQIVVSACDIESPTYIEKVQRFWQGTEGTEDLFGRLDLRVHPPTGPGTGLQTPGTGPIFLKKVIGQGAFGVVRHFWNVSTGEEFAVKQPSQEAILNRKVRLNDWAQEARIMELVSHDHIVKLFEAKLEPMPRFHLEYVPGGSLDKHRDISLQEGLHILDQCLSALTYLHGMTPPIVHRDIKPSNILVQSRSHGDIFVKFGDFGLSKDTFDPMTICGTKVYLAPELFMEQLARDVGYPEKSYTSAVDIWSLGVSAVQCVYGLPASGGLDNVAWCRRIVRYLELKQKSYPDPFKQFLLDRMVVMKPQRRASARDCYDQAQNLFFELEHYSPTPITSSFSQGYDADVDTGET